MTFEEFKSKYHITLTKEAQEDLKKYHNVDINDELEDLIKKAYEDYLSLL